MVRKRTPEEFDADLAAINDQVKRVGPFDGMGKKVLCKRKAVGTRGLLQALGRLTSS